MGDSAQSSGAALTAAPRSKSVIISEVENGFIVQEQFYPRRQFIAASADAACGLAGKALTSAAA